MEKQDGMAPIEVVLLDLDGVVRHFDPARREMIEQRHRLPLGAVAEAAFAPERLEPVITGQTTREEWVAQVGAAVGSPAAAQEWLADRGVVDVDMIELVDQLRAGGWFVAVLTNGTDTIPDEMQELGLADRFDRVFCTAEIGYAKPDRRAFEHVCHTLEVDPTAVFFTDDSPGKLGGALEIGMHAEVFDTVANLRVRLLARGVDAARLRD